MRLPQLSPPTIPALRSVMDPDRPLTPLAGRLLEARSPRGGGGSGGGGGGGRGGGGRGRGGGSRGGSTKSKPKTSSSSSGTGKAGGGTVIVHGGGGGGGGGTVLPAWAIVLIVLGVLDFLLFCGALAFYYNKERKTGNKIRHGRVWWKAFLIASFLWIPIRIWKLTCGKVRSKNRSPTSYSKIDEAAGAGVHDSGKPDGLHAGLYGNGGSGATSATTLAYGDGGAGYYGQQPAKYEPYTTIAPGASPNPSPYTSPNIGSDAKPTSIGATIDSSAAAAAAAAPGPEPGPLSPVGAAQDYYAQHPLGLSGPEPSPGPAAVTFPASAHAPPPTAPVNPFSMSASPYVPR